MVGKMMQQLDFLLFQLITMLVLAPLLNGVIKKVKAITQKRKGPPLLQPYYDLWKLFQKGTVISATASWIFKATPLVYFVTNIIAASLIPLVKPWHSGWICGDLILLVSLLALGRFFMTLAGLDTGSTFGAMGSSRDIMISTIFEPALLVSLFTLGLIAKSTSLFQMSDFNAHLGTGILQPVYILNFAALFVIVIAETDRIPVDDPATHLELTMVHEAMLLEYSGPYLALLEWGSSLRQLLLITLLVNLFLPVETLFGLGGVLALPVALLFYVIKVLLVAVLIGTFEVNMVKLRLFSVPNLAALSFILSFLGFFHYFVLGR
jgi:formate hydrogenlyase subunit 4